MSGAPEVAAPCQDIDIRALVVGDHTVGEGHIMPCQSVTRQVEGLSFSRAGTGTRVFRVPPPGGLIFACQNLSVSDHISGREYHLMPLDRRRARSRRVVFPTGACCFAFYTT